MKFFFLFIILVSAESFAYPKECTDIENKLIDLIAKLNRGDEPNNEIDELVPKLNSVTKKYPECTPNTIPLTRRLRVSVENYMAKQNADNSKPEKQIKKGSNEKKSQLVSYDEWFTLVNTNIKNGKKYSFIACIYGPRNATAVNCGSSGTKAKRIFYSTDDMRSLDAKKIWINSIEQKMCVEAYVTAGQAFVVDVGPETKCAN